MFRRAQRDLRSRSYQSLVKQTALEPALVIANSSSHSVFAKTHQSSTRPRIIDIPVCRVRPKWDTSESFRRTMKEASPISKRPSTTPRRATRVLHNCRSMTRNHQTPSIGLPPPRSASLGAPCLFWCDCDLTLAPGMLHFQNRKFGSGSGYMTGMTSPTSPCSPAVTRRQCRRCHRPESSRRNISKYQDQVLSRKTRLRIKSFWPWAGVATGSGGLRVSASTAGRGLTRVWPEWATFC